MSIFVRQTIKKTPFKILASPGAELIVGAFVKWIYQRKIGLGNLIALKYFGPKLKPVANVGEYRALKINTMAIFFAIKISI